MHGESISGIVARIIRAMYCFSLVYTRSARSRDAISGLEGVSSGSRILDALSIGTMSHKILFRSFYTPERTAASFPRNQHTLRTRAHPIARRRCIPGINFISRLYADEFTSRVYSPASESFYRARSIPRALLSKSFSLCNDPRSRRNRGRVFDKTRESTRASVRNLSVVS